MTAKVEFEVTSDQAGQIPAIGTFDGSGEDVVKMDEVQLRLFEITYGCKLAAANFPPYVHVKTILTGEPVEEPVENTEQAEVAEEEVQV